MGQAHFPNSETNTSTPTPTLGPPRLSWAVEDNLTLSEWPEVTGIGISGGGAGGGPRLRSVPAEGRGPRRLTFQSSCFVPPSSMTMCFVI